MDEIWRVIPGHSMYSVSSHGRIMNNRFGSLLSTSQTNHGHVKVSLWSDDSNYRRTRSVAVLVAQAFCKKPDRRSNSVVLLDGNLKNVAADNIVWRPQWFAWKYVRQFEVGMLRCYENLPILNIIEDVQYNSIIECCMTEGLLFEDVWRSTYTGCIVYPHQCVYQVLK